MRKGTWKTAFTYQSFNKRDKKPQAMAKKQEKQEANEEKDK